MSAAELQSVITTKSGSQVIGKQPSPILSKVKGPDLNLRDCLNQALSGEKQLTQGYTTSMNEAIDPSLHKLISQARDRVQGCHRRFFETMFELGEYAADVASQPQIADAMEVFTGYRSQLPYGKGGGQQPVH